MPRFPEDVSLKFYAALPQGVAIEGAAKYALKQNSQLIKYIVKVGVKQMAGKLLFPSDYVVKQAILLFFSLLRSRLS